MNPKIVLFSLCLLTILIPLTQGFPYKSSHEEEDEDEEEEDDKWGKFGRYGKNYGEDEEEEKEDYGGKKLFFPFHKKENEYQKKQPKWSSGGWSPISSPGLDMYGQEKYSPKYFKSYGSEEEEYPKKKKSYKKKSKKEEISKDILKEVDKYIPEIDFVDEEKKKA